MSMERLREGRGVLIRDGLLTPTLNLSSLFVSHFVPSRLTLLPRQQHFTSPPPSSPPLLPPLSPHHNFRQKTPKRHPPPHIPHPENPFIL